LEQIFSICNSDLSANFLNFGTVDLKSAVKLSYFLWRRDPVLELQFLTPLRVVLLCFATHLCRSQRDGCVKVAWWRGCEGMLLRFAVPDHKSHWSGCIKVPKSGFGAATLFV